MIKAILKKSRQALQQAHAVQVIFGCGITGDWHFKKATKKGQNITFIEAEGVDKYNQLLGQSISPQQTRRNVITRGVNMNALVSVEFSIGDTKLKGRGYANRAVFWVNY